MGGRYNNVESHGGNLRQLALHIAEGSVPAGDRRGRHAEIARTRRKTAPVRDRPRPAVRLRNAWRASDRGNSPSGDRVLHCTGFRRSLSAFRRPELKFSAISVNLLAIAALCAPRAASRIRMAPEESASAISWAAELSPRRDLPIGIGHRRRAASAKLSSGLRGKTLCKIACPGCKVVDPSHNSISPGPSLSTTNAASQRRSQERAWEQSASCFALMPVRAHARQLIVAVGKNRRGHYDFLAETRRIGCLPASICGVTSSITLAGAHRVASWQSTSAFGNARGKKQARRTLNVQTHQRQYFYEMHRSENGVVPALPFQGLGAESQPLSALGNICARVKKLLNFSAGGLS